MITMCRLRKATSACPHSGFYLYCLAYVAFTCLFILICQTLWFVALSTFLYFAVIYFLSEAGRHGGDPAHRSQHLTSHFPNSVLSSRTFSYRPRRLGKTKLRRPRGLQKYATANSDQSEYSNLKLYCVAYVVFSAFSRILHAISSQIRPVTPCERFRQDLLGYYCQSAHSKGHVCLSSRDLGSCRSLRRASV